MTIEIIATDTFQEGNSTPQPVVKINLYLNKEQMALLRSDTTGEPIWYTSLAEKPYKASIGDMVYIYDAQD